MRCHIKGCKSIATAEMSVVGSTIFRGLCTKHTKMARDVRKNITKQIGKFRIYKLPK